jgi:hypothetical protein
MVQREIGSMIEGLPNLVLASNISTIPPHRAVPLATSPPSAWNPREGITTDLGSLLQDLVG